MQPIASHCLSVSFSPTIAKPDKAPIAGAALANKPKCEAGRRCSACNSSIAGSALDSTATTSPMASTIGVKRAGLAWLTFNGTITSADSAMPPCGRVTAQGAGNMLAREDIGRPAQPGGCGKGDTYRIKGVRSRPWHQQRKSQHGTAEPQKIARPTRPEKRDRKRPGHLDCDCDADRDSCERFIDQQVHETEHQTIEEQRPSHGARHRTPPRLHQSEQQYRCQRNAQGSQAGCADGGGRKRAQSDDGTNDHMAATSAWRREIHERDARTERNAKCGTHRRHGAMGRRRRESYAEESNVTWSRGATKGHSIRGRTSVSPPLSVSRCFSAPATCNRTRHSSA